MDNLIGKDLGRYHILEQLGEGGMATVYKAYDLRLERNVAVKVILSSKQQSEKSIKRFEREAKALAQMTHPNIVHINDFGNQKGIPYLVMDFLPGGTLKARLGQPIPWQTAVRLLLPIAHALAYAHQQGIIHRDVKPSNILISESGESMLTDFGVAKILESEETMDLTGVSLGVGTPEYMAPEYMTSKVIDCRVDIYALGIVLYEMVVGRKPYQADTPLAVLYKQASEALPRPRSLLPGLPESVERVIFKALAKKPEDRYHSMEEFSIALEGLPFGQVKKGKKLDLPSLARPAEFSRSHRPSWLDGLIVLGILAGVYSFLFILIKGTQIPLFPNLVSTAKITTPLLIRTVALPSPSSLSIPTLLATNTAFPTEPPTPLSTPNSIFSQIAKSRNIPPVKTVIADVTFDTPPHGLDIYGNYKSSNGILSLNDPTSLGEPSGDGNSRLATQAPIVTGFGYLMVFQFKPETQFFVTFEFGPFNTNGYRAFWLRDTYVSIWTGTNEILNQTLRSPLVSGTWYCLALRRYPNGIEGIYWPQGFPEKVNTFNLFTDSDWAGGNLTFNVVVQSGIFNVDEYQELVFSSDASSAIFK